MKFFTFGRRRKVFADFENGVMSIFEPSNFQLQDRPL